jgi:N-acetylglucosamine-6-phosphate deacetylase
MERIKIAPVKLVTADGVYENSAVEIADGKIINVEISAYNGDNSGDITLIDGQNLYLSAGFIDIHLHGGGGGDFMDATEASFTSALKMHLSHGTTSLVPTTVAADLTELKEVFAVAKRMKNAINASLSPDLPEILGVHLEGPYIAKSMAGAQDPKYIKTPTDGLWREIFDAADGELLIWTAAPELAGSDEMCAELTKRGVYFSMGHTDARYSDVVRAVRSGYTMATHLYSGMSTIVRENGHRVLGAIESALLFDEIAVEVIADGIHLPPELLRLIYKTKGKDKIILVTDAMRGAGMPDGDYILGSLTKGQTVSVFDGIAHMPDRTAFAGSVATADRLVRTMVNEANVPMHEAVAMMTANAAKSIGFDERKGFIMPGFDADIVLFDDDINVKKVILRGRII